MKKYIKPIIEDINVISEEVLFVSGIEMNNHNAGFDLPDEVL